MLSAFFFQTLGDYRRYSSLQHLGNSAATLEEAVKRSAYPTISSVTRWSVTVADLPAKVCDTHRAPLQLGRFNKHGSGGVAERLIAPVLKTGRPKGLVSSNLTPSAILLRACASQDWQRSFARSRMPSEASAKEGRQCITFTSLKVSLRKLSVTWE